MALNQREKVLLTVPVLLGGVMGFYNWVHEPLSLRRDDARAKLEQVQAELKKDQTKLAKEGDLVARASTVATEEKLIDAWVPGKNAAALLVWHLSQAEQHSGVRIKGITFGDKKLVTNAAEQAQSGQPAGAQKPQAAAYEVTVIRLDMKVEGRYAEHLLFNQAVEGMPLFLNTDALSLQRAESVQMDEVTKLLTSGNTYAAQVLLEASPNVAGTYSLNLYFKTDKAGPATNAMAFAQGTGRSDPFVMDSVDSFIQSVLDFFANPGASGLPARGGGRFDSDPRMNNSGQMG